MDQLVRDPMWTFVGSLFAILAVLVAIAVFFAQRKIKRLSYEITSNTQLIGVKDEIQGKVQVLYEGEEVKNVHLLTLRFTNNGNQSISSGDYERSLGVTVNPEAKILTYEIIDEEPNKLGAAVSLEGNKLIISPVLLNAKDAFSIKALVSDLQGRPEIDGRINGIKSIMKHNDGQMSFFSIAFISMLLFGFGIFYLDKDDIISLAGLEIPRRIVGMSSIAFGYLLMTVAMFKNKRMLKMMHEIVMIMR
jgi:hypothetical protein